MFRTIDINPSFTYKDKRYSKINYIRSRNIVNAAEILHDLFLTAPRELINIYYGDDEHMLMEDLDRHKRGIKKILLRLNILEEIILENARRRMINPRIDLRVDSNIFFGNVSSIMNSRFNIKLTPYRILFQEKPELKFYCDTSIFKTILTDNGHKTFIKVYLSNPFGWYVGDYTSSLFHLINSLRKRVDLLENERQVQPSTLIPREESENPEPRPETPVEEDPQGGRRKRKSLRKRRQHKRTIKNRNKK